MFVGKLEYKLPDGDVLYTVEIGAKKEGEQMVMVSSAGTEATVDECRLGGIALRVLMDTLNAVEGLPYNRVSRIEVSG